MIISTLCTETLHANPVKFLSGLLRLLAPSHAMVAQGVPSKRTILPRYFRLRRRNPKVANVTRTTATRECGLDTDTIFFLT